MKSKRYKLITFMLLVVLSMAVIVGCSKDETTSADGIKAMKGDEVVKLNSGKKKDDILIIDVRSPEEYKAGHIPNAININIDEFESRLNEIEDLKDFPIILYCNSGNKSGKAAEILVNNGFKDVTNAQGVKEFEYDLVHYEDVRGAAFEKLIAENSDIVLVDVRPEDQVKKEGMIEGAINIPFDQIENNQDKLPKDKTIALYYNTGTKSAEAAKKLEELGYENVVNSIEGVKEYPFTLNKYISN